MRKITLLTVIIVFCIQCLNINAEYAPEYLKDNKSLPDYRNIRPFNGDYEIDKPKASFRIKNNNTGKFQDSYTGMDCNKPFPILNAIVGDTISFYDLSVAFNSNVKLWDFQYYGAEGSKNNIYNKSPLDGLKIKLTKVGTTTFYLAVMSDAEVTNEILPWSDNGNHQTIGPKTAQAPNGIFWYFTAITVKTVAAPPTPTPKATSTVKPTAKHTAKPTAKLITPKPVPTPAVSHSANITASAELYYVSDPGVDSIKSGYGFRLEVNTDVIVLPSLKTGEPGPTGAKRATAYFLGKSYPMEIKSSNGTKVCFHLPVDYNSVAKARKIYVPVNTPDGTYDIQIYIDGATYNGKSISKTIHKSITIKGNMYEDDYTAPKN